MKTKNMTTLHSGKSIGRLPLRLGFLLIPLVLAWFAFFPRAEAVSPPPDGGYPGQNTAEGDFALFRLTSGTANTASGFNALLDNTTGSYNTATGWQALFSNTSGVTNTATGGYALGSNRNGHANTANGYVALAFNRTGDNNTADGVGALGGNETGSNNTAAGFKALVNNSSGENNTASGQHSLASNTTGVSNTADGQSALRQNTTGSFNIALGANAGGTLTTGGNNIDIGNVGVAGENNTIRIGGVGTHMNTFIAGINGVTVAGGVGVIIDSNGQLGTVTSSERFKDEIKPMDKASEAVLALQPVTFRYKHELDPVGIPQFGLVAEQVAKVNPDLVARDHEGKPYTMRYEAVNAMLLNEFLKEHRTVLELKKEMAALTATMEEQAAQIHKVSARLAVSKPAPQTVRNNQ